MYNKHDALYNAAVGDRDAKDVRSEVANRGFRAANSLGVDDPVLFPDCRRNLLCKIGFFHFLHEDRPEHDGKRFGMDEQVPAGRNPFASVFERTAAGHDVVDVRMVLRLPSPGVEHARKPREVRSDEAFVRRQFLQGLGRNLKKRPCFRIKCQKTRP